MEARALDASCTTASNAAAQANPIDDLIDDPLDEVMNEARVHTTTS